MIDRLRREVLRGMLFGTGLLGGWILLDIWTGARRFTEARWQRLLAIDQLPPTGVVPLPDARVALVVTEQSLAAISLECTHLGCLVNATDHGFYCPCHGSDFGPQGEVYSGPATRDLPWHKVRLRHDAVWILAGTSQPDPFWHPRIETRA